MRDISARKREAERIRYLAEHDTLTGLANRNKLHERLGAMLAEADAKQCEVALLMIDLDKFKQINDTLGHACGDQLLCGVAERLNALVEGAGLVARLSGDEFAIVISGSDAVDRAKTLSERISLALSKSPFTVGARQLRVNGSIGVAVFQKDCETADELLGMPISPCIRQRPLGGAAMFFLSAGSGPSLNLAWRWRPLWRGRQNEHEFEMFYQPQVNLENGRLVGAEALIRWRHPGRGLVSPDDFMPVVNGSSISDGIALWVLETVCRQGRLWQQRGFDIRLGVNLSPSQFQSGDLAATVEAVLREHSFSPSLLELEVTESILLEDDERALEMFRPDSGSRGRHRF